MKVKLCEGRWSGKQSGYVLTCVDSVNGACDRVSKPKWCPLTQVEYDSLSLVTVEKVMDRILKRGN